jgi:hypothetical protein
MAFISRRPKPPRSVDAAASTSSRPAPPRSVDAAASTSSRPALASLAIFISRYLPVPRRRLSKGSGTPAGGVVRRARVDTPPPAPGDNDSVAGIPRPLRSRESPTPAPVPSSGDVCSGTLLVRERANRAANLGYFLVNAALSHSRIKPR